MEYDASLFVLYASKAILRSYLYSKGPSSISNHIIKADIHRIFWNYSIIYFKILTTIIQRVPVPRLYTKHNTCRLSKSVGEAIFYSNHLQITDTLYLHNQDPIWIYTSCLHTGHEPWLMSHLSTHFKWKTWWHWGKDLAVSPTSISCKIRIYY